MRSKTSKYTALGIIVIGILFIYFIPLFIKADNSVNRLNLINKDKILSNPQVDIKTSASKQIIQNKYAGIDGKLKNFFDEAEVIYLVGHIKLVETDKKHSKTKMYGTIVGIINKNNTPIRYKIGDKEYIGDWWQAQYPNQFPNPIVPEGAVLFLQRGSNYINNAENFVYFNYGKLASIYNGYSFEYIKAIFNKDDKIFENSNVKDSDANFKLKGLFDKADVIYLVDNIKVTTNNKKMHATVVELINKTKAPIDYKIGDNKFIGYWAHVPEGAKIPESAITFINSNKSSSTLYFNDGKLSGEFEEYTLEYVKNIINKWRVE